MQVNIPKLSRFATWQNAFYAVAAILVTDGVWNFASLMAYRAAPGAAGASPADELVGLAMTGVPVLWAIACGFIGKWMGLKPEYVEAMKKFSQNPTVVEFEQRAVHSAVDFVLPRLGDYPDKIFPILRVISNAYQNDPEVAAAISGLGQLLAKKLVSADPAPKVPTPA